MQVKSHGVSDDGVNVSAVANATMFGGAGADPGLRKARLNSHHRYAVKTKSCLGFLERDFLWAVDYRLRRLRAERAQGLASEHLYRNITIGRNDNEPI